MILTGSLCGMRQPDLCYRATLHLLSEVSVSDLWMCQVGVVGHSIHPPLCAATEETIQRHQRGEEWVARERSQPSERTGKRE